MNDVTRWPSLTDQVELAIELYGDRGPGLVGDWLTDQMGRIGNIAFARQFSDHISLPGVQTADYAHRHVRAARGDLIGGIRFYGRDVTRPFVEVVAHTFDDLAALRDCVSREWSAFAPQQVRLRGRPGRVTGPGTELDNSIHVARYRDMTCPDGRVRLTRFADPTHAVDLVDRRYRHLAQRDPALARNVSPEDPDDLLQWHDRGQLRAVRVGAADVGVLAVVPGAIGWIAGDEINEEVISAEYGGRGYAVSAQSAWAAHVATDPDRMLIGTIDRHNGASRTTALRAGRPRVLDDVFVRLPAG